MLRRYRLGQDEVDVAAPLPPDLFAEGICRVGSHLWQLTWREQVALRWDLRSPDPAGDDLLQPARAGAYATRVGTC
jgi:glutamine cyclotransferase